MSKTTRRKFLKDSLAAGTAFAVCGTKSTARVSGANNRLRIAVAGVNGRGGSHIKGWLEQDNVEIAYLIDPDKNVLAKKLKYLEEKTEGKFACRGVTDVREALDDKNLDAISIATPNHWHSLITIWAAQAGKHVYVEKPLSHDVVEGRVAVEAQKKYGVVIQHGTQRRSSADNAGLHDLIRSRKFGK
ncbi:MAG: Gfo/Idh/MocA family protein, partial [Planctomycetota bacterium]